MRKPAHWFSLAFFYWRMLRRIEADPNKHAYTDLALTAGQVAPIDGSQAA